MPPCSTPCNRAADARSGLRPASLRPAGRVSSSRRKSRLALHRRALPEARTRTARSRPQRHEPGSSRADALASLERSTVWIRSSSFRAGVVHPSCLHGHRNSCGSGRKTVGIRKGRISLVSRRGGSCSAEEPLWLRYTRRNARFSCVDRCRAEVRLGPDCGEQTQRMIVRPICSFASRSAERPAQTGTSGSKPSNSTRSGRASEATRSARV